MLDGIGGAVANAAKAAAQAAANTAKAAVKDFGKKLSASEPKKDGGGGGGGGAQRASGGGASDNGQGGQQTGGVEAVPALWIPPDNSGTSTKIVPAFYAAPADATTEGPPVLLVGDETPATDPATGEPEPTFPELNDPVSNSLKGLLEDLRADPTTDPEAKKANEVAEATAEFILWSKEAERLKQIAEDKAAATDKAEKEHGTGSQEHVLALGEQKAAEAAYAEALAKANEAKGKLDVYALDPSYKSARGKAQARVNGVLKKHNLQFTMPTPGGTLGDAQARLKDRQTAAQNATQARQEYEKALGLLRQLPPGYVPGQPFQEPGPSISAPGEGEGYDTKMARERAAYAERARIYAEAVLAISKGDKLLADSQVLTLETDLKLTKPGTEAHKTISGALETAKQQQAQAGNNLAANEKAYALKDAEAYRDGLLLDKQLIVDRAVADLAARSPHLFQADGFVDGRNKYSGKYQGYETKIGKDGQLYLIIHYEHKTLEIQLTFAPGKRNRASDTQTQIDNDWRELTTDPQRCVTNVFDYAHQRVRDASTGDTQLKLDEVNDQIPQLQKDYLDALAKHSPPPGSPPAGSPGGPPLHPEVIEAQTKLNEALALRDQLSANLDWLGFLQGQSLTNLDNPMELERLRKEYFIADEDERQRLFKEANAEWGMPQKWEGAEQRETGILKALGLESTSESREMAGTVSDAIAKFGGDKASVQVAPVFLAMDGGGLHKTALFVVTDSDGQRHIIDDLGRDYDDLDEYKEDHKLPAGGTLYLPENLQFTTNGAGEINITSMKVEGDPWTKADLGVGIVTSVATVLSFTPAAPVAAPIAIAGGVYMGARSTMRLIDMYQHGQSWASKQGAMELAMVVTSALPVAGGAVRTAGVLRNAGTLRAAGELSEDGIGLLAATRTGFGAVNYGKPALAVDEFGSQVVVNTGRWVTPFAQDASLTMQQGGKLLTTAKVLDVGGMVIGAPLMLGSGADLVMHWNQMSGLDRVNGVLGLTTGVYGTGRGVRGLIYEHQARQAAKNTRNGKQNGNNGLVVQPGRPGAPAIGTPGHLPVSHPNGSQSPVNGASPGAQGANGNGHGGGAPRVTGTGGGNRPSPSGEGGTEPVFLPLTSSRLFVDLTAPGMHLDASEAGANGETRRVPRVLVAATPENGVESGAEMPVSAGQRLQLQRLVGEVEDQFLADMAGRRRPTAFDEEMLETRTIEVRPRRSQWRPSENDRTLVVGGGHAYRAPSEGEVFLDKSGEARPDILSDIRSTPIPSDHFESVYFEHFPYTPLREEGGRALSETYRVMKPGGSLVITTGPDAIFGGDQRGVIVQGLRKAGFTDIDVQLVPDAANKTRNFTFTATKPQAPAQGTEIGGAKPLSAVESVTIVPAAQWERVAAPHLPEGVEAGGLMAFVPYTDGVAQGIFIKDTLATRPLDYQRRVIAHEVAHFHAHPDFVRMAMRLRADPNDPHSNLVEGAAEHLARPVAGQGDEGEVATADYLGVAATVNTVAGQMGRPLFREAYRNGDPAALNMFRSLALQTGEVTEVADASPSSRGSLPGFAPARQPRGLAGDGYTGSEWPQFYSDLRAGRLTSPATRYVYVVAAAPRRGVADFTGGDILYYGTIPANGRHIRWRGGNVPANVGARRIADIFGAPPAGKQVRFLISTENPSSVLKTSGDMRFTLHGAAPVPKATPTQAKTPTPARPVSGDGYIASVWSTFYKRVQNGQLAYSGERYVYVVEVPRGKGLTFNPADIRAAGHLPDGATDIVWANARLGTTPSRTISVNPGGAGVAQIFGAPAKGRSYKFFVSTLTPEQMAQASGPMSVNQNTRLTLGPGQGKAAVTPPQPQPTAPPVQPAPQPQPAPAAPVTPPTATPVSAPPPAAHVPPVAPPTSPPPPAPAAPLAARPGVDVVYPIQLWPDVLASINRGGLGSTGSYVYVVPVAKSDFGGPLSITPSQFHAIGRAAPNGDQVLWEAGRATQVASPRSVYDHFGAPPADHGWGFVLSQYAPDQIRQAGGMTNLVWQGNKADIPGYPQGPAYQRPEVGLRASFSDKTRGPRPFGAVETVLNTRQALRGLGRNVFLPELGWVTRAEAEAFRNGMTDRRYTSMHAADLVGKAPIPPQDDAAGLNVADVHYHPNTFPHPRYLKMSTFMERIDGGKDRGLISGAKPKIVLTFENIPYQTQALAGNWLGYTAFDANRITTRYAFLDDWKVLAQWERLAQDHPEWRDRAIPSITGMEMYRVADVSEYGSKMGAEQYLSETLLWFSDAYPITGENTIRNKEVWGLLLGSEKPHMGLIPGQYGAETPRDYATIEQAMDVVRDAGLVFVGHHDAGTTEIAVDGRPFAAPSDTRDFFALTNVLMRLGAYDLSGVNFADVNFRLSDSEAANIVSRGPVRRPLRYIGAHGLGIKLNDSSVVAQMELMQWTFAHPLLRHVNADSSWLPVIERLMQNRQNIGPMADLIQTGRVFYGSDVLNIQNFEQWAAPWYAQQRLLREVQSRDPQALNTYASEGFLKLYEESKPDIDWFRYRQARAAGLGTDARVTDLKLAEFVDGVIPASRRQKLESWVNRYEQTHRSELFDTSGAFDHSHFNALVSKDSRPGLHARGAAVTPAVFHTLPSTPALPRTPLRNTELGTALYEQIELGRAPSRPIAEITGHSDSEPMTLPPGTAAKPAQPAPTPPLLAR